ncbi:PREDICTED: uncharacterized protein LOC105959711 [Erythranthe guttata]|uniref:uncharacterized protein LOC105959711 n=1 Tax=Erythranthe guttata TaxID=4155 RepID=UPI00064D78B8|nr:PREDICTED: uncharacterized protein LOC105959711 [Erythranthe guttata]|eukprot:XP_012839301.1 PREDICTED: uncharacterized protein LOC105959711 [Erythranthe guttata]
MPPVETHEESNPKIVEDPFQEEIMSSPYEIPITVDLDRSDILLDNTINPVEVLPGEVRDDSMTSTGDVGIDEEEEEEEEEFEDSDSENNTNQHYVDSTSTDDEDG